MAYGSVGSQLIRLTDGWRGKVGKPFWSAWECDPCALPGRRYRLSAIKDAKGEWVELPYWAVILPEDDARTRYIKWAANKEVNRIRDEAERLRRMERDALLYGPRLAI